MYVKINDDEFHFYLQRYKGENRIKKLMEDLHTQIKPRLKQSPQNFFYLRPSFDQFSN